MPRIPYIYKKFRDSTWTIIQVANEILEEYIEQGFDLTLRQLYYQFVARDILPNTEQSYNNLGNIINNSRLAGLTDWEYIVDRTRNIRKNPHWDSPAEIVKGCSEQFMIDKWINQENRIEVWIEKDALVGVISGICHQLDIPYFSCRGYTSQSEMWSASQRLIKWEKEGYNTYILHLGDHDPSGIDMTRDIEDRLHLFRSRVEIKRIALNMDQIERYSPPPNPAKVTDSRAPDYVSKYGIFSWELDALEPRDIVDLIRNNVSPLCDQNLWDEKKAIEDEGRALLSEMADSMYMEED